MLTPANVNSSSFGLLVRVKLDDQVDAQPLVVPGVNITTGDNQGTHDVVYVVTESNTVYAIDANAGTVLLTRYLGKPVQLPLGCNNNGPNVGINSTPVIDASSNTLYVITYIQDGTDGPTHRLHALDLGSLVDKATPKIVAASHTLTDGTTFVFQRDLPAATSRPAAGERQHLRRVRQLLRSLRQPLAGLAAGLECGDVGSVLG